MTKKKISIYSWLTGIIGVILMLLPTLALAGGEAATEIVVVADTRRLTGLNLYFANLYNESPLIFAIWSVGLTAAMGCILGFLMDFLMARTGLDLKSRKIIEH